MMILRFVERGPVAREHVAREQVSRPVGTGRVGAGGPPREAFALAYKALIVAVLLAALQLTSAGGIWPVDTAPALFQWLHGALPLTYAVDGLRRIVAGVSSGVGTDVAVLLVTLVGSLHVTTYAARRQRTWTMRRLRPVVAA